LNGDGKLDLVIANTWAVTVLLNATGLCAVPQVKGKALPLARRSIARAGCRVGKVRRGYSPAVKTGRVISQKPTPGRVLANGGKVNLVVSRGRNQ
jgi:beta-lactam-binding protein with PASTA domain